MNREREEDKRNSLFITTILSIGFSLISMSIVFDERKEDEKVIVASEEQEREEIIQLYCNAAG